MITAQDTQFFSREDVIGLSESPFIAFHLPSINGYIRYEEGRTYEEIGKIVGLSLIRVYMICKAWEFRSLLSEDTTRVSKKIEPHEVVKRYLEGQRQIDIARDLGVTQSLISYIVKRFKATKNKRAR